MEAVSMGDCMGMTLFWILAGVIALGVGAILVQALLRGGRGAAPAAAYDMQVYRDQLREIERDLARGTIAAEEADRLKAEVSRRLLEADRAARSGESDRRAPGSAAIAATGAVLLLLGGSFAAYLDLGAPGYPDMPLAARMADADAAYRDRPSQAEAEARMAASHASTAPAPDPQFVELMEKLREAVTRNPNDIRGQELLARNEAALGHYAAAARAQEQVIALSQPKATAEDHAALAELMILAAGGAVSPEAEAQLTEALRIDPSNGTARYYSGLLLAQTGRPDMAFRLWRALLEGSRPGDPWVAPLRAQIEELAWLAGAKYQLPPAPAEDTGTPGPTQEEMQAAGEMTPEQRQEMVRGMVEGLNERLATEGGTASEWARLISALGVLGETDRARAIYGEAMGRFEGREPDLAAIRAAAVQAGVAE
ncbi:c-type cytochrome biogenesis protein CcmI [Cereibacter sediminicola]|uniref:c-type cytochrome biogenesis protein CcmI n=1 Tax=Cereibacter sediminicola TaxID=2584941 RepID=UPI0011A7A4FB|nr:c-type cytochrome biogenesis protein CcmI [Cereibacter sediminicola]